MSVEAALGQELAQRIGWVLVHFLWQGAAVGAAAAVILWCMRKSNARKRYAAACAALAVMAATPFVTFILTGGGAVEETTAPEAMQPKVVWYAPADEATSEEFASAEVEAIPEEPLQEAPPQVEISGIETQVAATATPADGGRRKVSLVPIAAPTAPAQSRWAEMRGKVEGALPYLVVLWLAGVFVLSVRLAGGWVKVRSMKTRGTREAAAKWQEAMGRIAKRLSVSRTVHLLESAVATVPVVIGALKPVILIPAGAFTGLTAEQLEAIIAHELAHVARWDYLVNLVQTAIETVLFYHPCVWWISKRIREERENCCDDAAVAACGNRILYARALADLEGTRATSSLAMAAVGGTFMNRIGRLMGRSDERRPGAWIALPLAITAVVLSLAFLVNSARAEKEGEEVRVIKADPGTVAGILDQAQGGDTIVLTPGAYAGKITVKTSGEEGKPITIKAEKQGATLGETIEVYLGDAKWVVVEDITCKYINISNCENCTVRHCTVTGPMARSVQINDSAGITIEDSEVSGATRHGIGGYGELTDMTLRGNYVHDNGGCGIAVFPESSTVVGPVVRRALIENNVITRNGKQYGGAAMNFVCVQDSIIRNNLIYKNYKGGIVFFQDAPDQHCERNKVVGNTVYFEPGKGFYCFRLLGGCKDMYVRNNIFWGGMDGPVTAIEESFDGLDMDYNVIGNYEGQTVLGEQTAGEEEGYTYTLGYWKYEKGLDQHSVFGEDPEFVSVENDDYRLKNDSPALGSGDNVTEICATDIMGAARASDCGAYEMGGKREMVRGPLAAPEDFDKAVAALSPGDTLVIIDGEYGGDREITISGRPEARIVIKAAGKGATFTGGAVGLTLKDCRWVTVEGIKCSGQSDYGVMLDNSGDSAVSDVSVTEPGKYGIYVKDSANARITGNDIDASKRHGMRVSGMSSGTVIARNYIHDSATCGIIFDTDETPDTPLSNLVLEENTFARNGTTGGACLNVTHIHDSVIRNNLFYRNKSTAIAAFRDRPDWSDERVSITGNTIYFAPDEGRYGIKLSDGCKDFVVTGNILWGGKLGPLCISEDSLGGLVSDYNLVGNYPDMILIGDASEDMSGFVWSPAQWQHEKGFDTNSVFGEEPLFVSAEKDDYRLEAKSPAVNAGAPDTVKGGRDIAGTARPQGSRADIGCYEFVADTATAEARPATQEMTLKVVDASGAAVDGVEVSVQRNAVKERFAAVAGPTAKVSIGGIVDYLAVEIRSKGYAPMRLVWEDPRGVVLPKEYTARPARAVTVGGVVQTAEGTGVGGAKVILSTEASREVERPMLSDAEIVADAKGHWEYAFMPEGLEGVEVNAVHGDYVFVPTGTPTTKSLMDKTAVVMMRQKNRFEGIVVDEAGNAIEANLQLGVSYDVSVSRTAHTDAEGRFVYEDAPAGETQMLVRAAGYAPYLATVTVKRSEEPMKVILAKGKALKVRVVDDKGAAVEGASVYVNEYKGIDLSFLLFSARTDAEGRAAWLEAPEESVNITVSKTGYMYTAYDLVAGDEEHVVTLLPSPAVRGKVVDAETGEPVESFKVIPGQEPRTWGGQVYWQHNEVVDCKDGWYEIAEPFRTNFSGGTKARFLRVEARGYRPEVMPVELTGRVVEVDFSLVQEAGIVGTVVNEDGTPAAGVEVGLGSQRQTVHVQNMSMEHTEAPKSTTDEKGEFWFPSQEGDYTLAAIGEEGFAVATKAEFEKTGTVTLQKFAKVEGTVTRGGKGAAEADIAVNVQRNARGIQGAYFYYNGQTDAEGRFVFEKVEPGYAAVGLEEMIPFGGGSYTTLAIESAGVKLVGGETAQVAFEDAGVTVRGRLMLAPDQKVSTRESRVTLVALPSDEGIAKRMLSDDRGAQQQAISAWRMTGPGMKDFVENRSYGGKISENGSFEMANVREGDYVLNFALYADDAQRRFVPIAGVAGRKIQVGEGNEVLDLGVIRTKNAGPVTAGENAPVIEMTTIDGRTLKSVDDGGKYVLLYFWSSQNRACRAGAKVVSEINDRYAGGGRLTVVGLCVDDKEVIAKYAAEQSITWPQCAIGNIETSEAADEYSVTGIPQAFLISPDGKVVASGSDAKAIAEAADKALGGTEVKP